MSKKEQITNMPENVIISKPENLEAVLKKFKEQGPEKIHVLADFDRTLTQAFVNGEKITSIIAILRKANILNDVYARRTEDLFNHYHAFEIDQNLTLLEKKEKMKEWWSLHNQELLKHGLMTKHLDQVAENPKIKLRPGLKKFLSRLNKQNIPLVIMSASGLGEYVIRKILEREKINFPNIHIISNTPVFNDQGKLVSFKEPIIHVFNKDETMLKDFPSYDQIKDRTNVILLGDNIEDIGMVEGFDYDNLLKIGFLNDNVETGLNAYKQNFDVVLTNDTGLDYANTLLNQIL